MSDRGGREREHAFDREGEENRATKGEKSGRFLRPSDKDNLCVLLLGEMQSRIRAGRRRGCELSCANIVGLITSKDQDLG